MISGARVLGMWQRRAVRVATWRVQLAMGYAAFGLFSGELLPSFGYVLGDLDYLAQSLENNADVIDTSTSAGVLAPVFAGLHLARGGQRDRALRAWRDAEQAQARISRQPHALPGLPRRLHRRHDD